MPNSENDYSIKHHLFDKVDLRYKTVPVDRGGVFEIVVRLVTIYIHTVSFNFTTNRKTVGLQCGFPIYFFT